MNVIKGLRFEIKGIAEDGTFEGLLSPYGNVDGGGDLVLPGAFTKTLKEQGDTRPMLWQHKADQPIGLITLEDRPEGLWCKGSLLMELPDAKKAYLLIKAKIVKGLSIGFIAMKDAVENGVRKLSEIKLYEGSVVTFPMNESALILSVKKRQLEQKGDFNEELTERQLSDAGYQMRCALWDALYSAFWSGLGKDEVIAASAIIIEQFQSAYMDYLPSYIDLMTEYYGDLETWHAKTLETKAGRMISEANRLKLQSAIDTISALLTEEAGDSATSADSKAAQNHGQPSPVAIDHKAAAAQLKNLKQEMKWNSRNS